MSVTVWLKTLEVGDRFYFAGDWQTVAGEYTVLDPHAGPGGYYVRVEGDEGLWHQNVRVSKVLTKGRGCPRTQAKGEE